MIVLEKEEWTSAVYKFRREGERERESTSFAVHTFPGPLGNWGKMAIWVSVVRIYKVRSFG